MELDEEAWRFISITDGSVPWAVWFPYIVSHQASETWQDQHRTLKDCIVVEKVKKRESQDYVTCSAYAAGIGCIDRTFLSSSGSFPLVHTLWSPCFFFVLGVEVTQVTARTWFSIFILCLLDRRNYSKVPHADNLWCSRWITRISRPLIVRVSNYQGSETSHGS